MKSYVLNIFLGVAYLCFDFKPVYDRGEVTGFLIVSVTEAKRESSIMNLNDISLNIFDFEI